MEKTVTLTKLANNYRYKLLQDNMGNHYLLDIEYSLIGCVIYFASWFIPQKIYRVSPIQARKIKRLSAPTRKKRVYWWAPVVCLVVLRSIRSITMPPIAPQQTYLGLFIALSVCTVIRIRSSQKQKEKIASSVKVSELTPVVARVMPDKINGTHWGYLSGQIICIVCLYAIIRFDTEHHTLFTIGILSVLYYVILLFHQLAFQDGVYLMERTEVEERE